jgi:LPXTG-motif cell wall-anchored protein
MKKQTTTTGPTGMRRMRSLVAFRHSNPVGRFVSTLLALSIAMLLVAGTGAAYADGTATPDPALSGTGSGDTTSTPSDTSSDPAPATEDPAPAGDTSAPAADESAPASDTASSDTASTDTNKNQPTAPATSTDAAPGTSGGKTSGPMMSTLTKLASPTPNLVGNADCQDTPNTMVGGFEIDGDPCADEGGIDFDGGCPAPPAEPGCPGDTTDDGYGDNGNWFTQGSSENDNPATWTMTGNSNTGKADIGTAWAWSHTYHSGDIDPVTPGVQLDPTDGHVFAYFGFTNDSTAGGSQDYSLVYNQADPVNGKPVRTPGDLLFHFFANGNVALTYEASYIYTDQSDSTWDDGTCVESGTLGAGWCPFDLPADAFVSAASPTGEYVEGAIDITAMFGEGTCSGTFGTTFLRSAPGAFFTSELKDYVAPLDVTTPSTCGSLKLEKKDVDTKDFVGGGVYQIVGDPRPGANPDDTLCIYDGPAADLAQLQTDHPELATECDTLIADGTADGKVDVGEVEPGTYTVTELVPPPGYLLNPGDGNTQEVTVGEGGDETVTFENHKKWAPLTITKTADGTHGAKYFWDIEKYISPTGLDGSWVSGTTPGAPLVKNVADGGDTKLYYKLVVTEDHVDNSAYVVTGIISVGNDNPDPVTATIGESLTGCTLDSNDAAFPLVDNSVPAGGADYAYTCDLGNGPVDPGTNTATVSWDKSTYPQTTDDIDATGSFSLDATDDYTFAETDPIDKMITVQDDHFTFDPAWTITWGDDTSADDGDPVGVYSSGVYSVDTETASGTCSAVVTNTGTITGDDPETILDQDSESGKVCVAADLTVGATVQESLVRTFPWTIDKATTTPNLQTTGGAVVAHYTVTVTAGASSDSDWAMSGTVTVDNPNDFEAVDLTDVSVDYTGAADETCTVNEPVDVSVPASGSQGFTFDCVFPTEPNLTGAIVATATWDGASAGTPGSTADNPVGDVTNVIPAEWTVTPVNETTNVWDDNATPGNTADDTLLATLHWADVYAMDNHQKVLAYSITISTGLPAAGACNVHTNTAKILGDEDVQLDDDTADVRVCRPAVSPPPAPPQVEPPSALPNTGGPDAMILAAGVLLLLGGGALVIGDRRRKHRS